jgi:hypothetical protein
LTLVRRFSIKRPGNKRWESLSRAPTRTNLIRGQVAKSSRNIFLHYRSPTTRSNRARFAPLIQLVLALLCAVGCQSNTERDLAARDRRLQEDQLYAMQDYISQYQQLVCRYRQENTALKRRLEYDCDGAPVAREPQPVPRTPTTSPTNINGPKIETSPTPGKGQQPAPSPNLDMPDVPPLKQGGSASNDIPPEPREVLPASYFAPIKNNQHISNGEPASAGGSPNSKPTQPSTKSPNILLSGEVVANETGGGPRLVIDIEPFDQAGQSAPFNGTLSLMLVASKGNGQQQKLSRWDFAADEVRSALVADTNEPTMRFHIEVPKAVNVADANELWVRLVPAGGGKMLTHAKIDLSRPGVFSSRTDKIWPSEESPIVAAGYEEPVVEPAAKPADLVASEDAPITPSAIAPMTEGTWATAQPNKPANLPSESDRVTGGWRASSEPIPAVIAPVASRATVTNEPPAIMSSQTKNAAAAIAPKKPSWSAERPGGTSQQDRPTWSATR